MKLIQWGLASALLMSDSVQARQTVIDPGDSGRGRTGSASGTGGRGGVVSALMRKDAQL